MDPEAIARIAELLGVSAEDVTELSLEELRDLIGAAFDEGAESEEPDLERLTALTEAAETVAAAIGAAETAEADRAARIEELRSRVSATSETAEEEEDGGEDGEATDGEPATPVTPEPPVADGVEVPVEEAEMPQAVAASAIVPLRRRRPAAYAPVQTDDGALVTITAAADVPGISAGGPIRSLRQIGQAFADRVEGVRGARGMAGKIPVAKLRLHFPEDRMLGQFDSAEVNGEKIGSVLRGINQETITAAGGLCAPVAVRYDLENISIDARPVRDALPRFNANRGGINFITPPTLSQVAAGVDVITAEEDAASATKPCLTITCGTPTEVDVSAVYACLTVGNFNRKFFPEQFATWWALAGAQHAREAEGQLLDGIGAASTQVADGQNLGAARDLLESNYRAAARYRNRHRMSPSAPMRLLLPAWVKDMMAGDLVREQPGASVERFATTDGAIDSWFRARNINTTWYLDTEAGESQTYGAEGSGVLGPWNTTVVGYMFHEGAFIFLDGGELDFGTEIRDTAMNEANNVRAFMETFENVAFIGVESLEMTYNLCLSGASSLPIAVTCPEGS